LILFYGSDARLPHLSADYDSTWDAVFFFFPSFFPFFSLLPPLVLAAPNGTGVGAPGHPHGSERLIRLIGRGRGGEPYWNKSTQIYKKLKIWRTSNKFYPTVNLLSSTALRFFNHHGHHHHMVIIFHHHHHHRNKLFNQFVVMLIIIK